MEKQGMPRAGPRMPEPARYAQHPATGRQTVLAGHGDTRSRAAQDSSDDQRGA